MTDDLDDLKTAIHAATPAPDAQKRAKNLALAQENFDTLQGLAVPTRPKSIWTKGHTMIAKLTTPAALTLTTACVAVGFLTLSPQGQNLWQPPTIVEPAVMDATSATPAIEAEVAAPAPMADQLVTNAPMAQKRSSVSVQTIARPEPVLATPANTERFANAPSNPLQITAENPVSTFSIDVDTASYAVVRNALMNGQLPPANAVRVEEMINYFPYEYPTPTGDAPFQPTIQVGQTPWNPDTQLVHIALQGAQITERPPLNLVFLIDTSGSMNQPNKLPLLIQSFRLMLGQLQPNDEVAIVTYAGSAGQVLAPTKASERETIEAALANLSAGGSTAGQAGLTQAYALAQDMAQDGDVSRVILATDGDFNVGLSDPLSLKDFIAEKRQSGTYLSVLGFGRGNLNDATMQSLAQNGNGTAAYIDTLPEAQKVLVDQLSGALFTIAEDVKVQVEFNPARVAEYRLIGYETRALNREDFNNDRVDAGEIGAGHSVTAIYEITPVGSPAQLSDPLRYSSAETPSSDELGYLKLRYKTPGASQSALIETPLPEPNDLTNEAKFAVAIAGFGQMLRGHDLGGWSFALASRMATDAKGGDPFGYRAQAIQMMRLADSLSK
ncbi:VWA domain-containing protein [Nereida sp. MMG025]|uniref:vWA domain-containing protein n=1 Tax=Nereida sp. MMG025 TaxID=2909981 RepID=UPI001F3686A9|nr:VWA domain-containing protein [Nereida sp. MMG025]MCF6445460.1 VWA domain-containing protein [Nereida sp. MMG025]